MATAELGQLRAMVARASWPEQATSYVDSLGDQQDRQLAQGLGWFSIALGALEVIAPQQTAQMIGARNSDVLPLFGLREIAAGIGILSQQRPATWLWSRVAGDFMDLAYLASQHLCSRADSRRLGLAMAAVAGVTILDIVCAERMSRRPKAADSAPRGDGSIYVRRAITINASPQELYQAWRKFDEFPRFMRHLKSVETTGDQTSHWVAHAPAGMTVAWDAEITADEPGRRLAWQSTSSVSVDHQGSVEFAAAPGSRGTELVVELFYRPLGGVMGASLANIFGESPEFQIQEDLRHFKQLMETGELTTTEGQPSGRGRSLIPGL